MKQSELGANTCDRHQVRENACAQVMIGLVFLTPGFSGKLNKTPSNLARPGSFCKDFITLHNLSSFKGTAKHVNKFNPKVLNDVKSTRRSFFGPFLTAHNPEKHD